MVSSSDITETKIPETSPLPPNSFSGLVEAALQERFGSDAARIVESWRLLELDYEHKEFVGRHQTPPITNPETSNCFQQAHSFVPNLKATQFYNVENMEWARKLKKQYKTIKSEFSRVTADMDKLTQEGNNIWAGALTEDASSYGMGWRTLVLMDRGVWDPVNVNLFPKTSKAIHDSGAPVVEAFFASMQPHTDIKLHTDNTNFVVTSHLAIDIPESGNNKCRLTIGDETKEWINGEILMFDTSIMHAAVNESDKTRYILMLRLWHPDLDDIERQALQFTYDCLQMPELVSNNAQERAMAEQQLATLHDFPEIKRGSGSAAGFGGGGGAKKQDKKRGRKK
jgi:aspartate beta-hydroxylase